MSPYLAQEPRTLEQVAAELDAQIAVGRELVAHHRRIIASHEAVLIVLEDRRDSIGDELVRRAR